MNITPQRYVHVGFGNVICANRVSLILNPQTANARRLVKAAKEARRPNFVDMSLGRTTKSLQLLDDGTVIGCALTYRTLLARFNAESVENDIEEEGHENHPSVSKNTDTQ